MAVRVAGWIILIVWLLISHFCIRAEHIEDYGAQLKMLACGAFLLLFVYPPLLIMQIISIIRLLVKINSENRLRILTLAAGVLVVVLVSVFFALGMIIPIGNVVFDIAGTTIILSIVLSNLVYARLRSLHK